MSDNLELFPSKRSPGRPKTSSIEKKRADAAKRAAAFRERSNQKQIFRSEAVRIIVERGTSRSSSVFVLTSVADEGDFDRRLRVEWDLEFDQPSEFMLASDVAKKLDSGSKILYVDFA